MEIWQAIVAMAVSIITALGGYEFVKYVINRKNNQRLSDTEADSEEFRILKEVTEFLQEQLRNKEERFAEQTDRLRQSQDREFKLLEENGKLKLDIQRWKCITKKCERREPQNGF